MAPQAGQVRIDSAQLFKKNFAGGPDKFNPKGGKRTFLVFLEPSVAAEMLQDGWNVKYLQPREDDDPGTEPKPYLSVEVAYDKGKPPRIFMITGGNRTFLGEEEVELVDQMDISNVDLIINPYVYDVNGKQGVKAYLKTMFVTVEMDELDVKYADMQVP